MLFAWAPRLTFMTDPVRSMSSGAGGRATGGIGRRRAQRALVVSQLAVSFMLLIGAGLLIRSLIDRKSTRLNSSHLGISYAVFCLKKKEHAELRARAPDPRARRRVLRAAAQRGIGEADIGDRLRGEPCPGVEASRRLVPVSDGELHGYEFGRAAQAHVARHLQLAPRVGAAHAQVHDLEARLRSERAQARLEHACFFNDPATAEIYTLSLHDALPI